MNDIDTPLNVKIENDEDDTPFDNTECEINDSLTLSMQQDDDTTKECLNTIKNEVDEKEGEQKESENLHLEMSVGHKSEIQDMKVECESDTFSDEETSDLEPGSSEIVQFVQLSYMKVEDSDKEDNKEEKTAYTTNDTKGKKEIKYKY